MIPLFLRPKSYRTMVNRIREELKYHSNWDVDYFWIIHKEKNISIWYCDCAGKYRLSVAATNNRRALPDYARIGMPYIWRDVKNLINKKISDDIAMEMGDRK